MVVGGESRKTLSGSQSLGEGSREELSQDFAAVVPEVEPFRRWALHTS